MKILRPNSRKSFEIGLTDMTWWDLSHGTAIHKILKKKNHNFTEKQALKCAQALNNWEPPKHWYKLNKEQEAKQMLLDFFNSCKGFNIYE